MSNIQKIILGVLFTAIIAGVGAYVFFVLRAPANTDTPSGSIFGDGSSTVGSGDGAGTATSEGDGALEGEEGEVATARERLLLIHKSATAGGVMFEKRDEGVFARSMERGLGHVYETNMETREEQKISNETRTGIHEALFGIDGSRVFIRYVDPSSDTIRTFSLFVGRAGGEFLPEDIQYMTLSPADAKKAFYLLATANGAVGTIYDADTKKKRQVFSSPFSEWLAQWVNKTTILLASKPASGVAGVVYFLNADTERAEKILDNVAGLTALASPNAKKVLFGEGGDGTIRSYIFDIQTGESAFLPFKTMPEKCAWEQNSLALLCFVPRQISAGNYPDVWYQGVVSFSDDLWRFDPATFNQELLTGFAGVTEGGMDGIAPTLSPDGDYLLFQNKKDMSLWTYRLADF